MSRAQKTRDRLQEEAVRLFAERGFDSVTVEEVARAAGVSHMTFFRHFPTKESVVLDDAYDPLLAKAVARQDPSLPPLERVRRAILEAWGELPEPSDHLTRTRIELAASHPSLRSGVWENNQRTADSIVEALTVAGVEPLEAKVAAGAVLGSITVALFDWAEDARTGSLGDRVRAALEILSPETSTA
ncbi:MAG: TetR family transcriptional regulator [Acidimicrobiia bacterium]|jgi:AcrR family transcriptional regulator